MTNKKSALLSAIGNLEAASVEQSYLVGIVKGRNFYVKFLRRSSLVTLFPNGRHDLILAFVLGKRDVFFPLLVLILFLRPSSVFVIFLVRRD